MKDTPASWAHRGDDRRAVRRLPGDAGPLPRPPLYRAPILLGVGLVIVLLVHLTGWLLARRKLFRNKLTGSLLAAAAVGIGMILLRLIVFH